MKAFFFQYKLKIFSWNQSFFVISSTSSHLIPTRLVSMPQYSPLLSLFLFLFLSSFCLADLVPLSLKARGPDPDAKPNPYPLNYNDPVFIRQVKNGKAFKGNFGTQDEFWIVHVRFSNLFSLSFFFFLYSAMTFKFFKTLFFFHNSCGGLLMKWVLLMANCLEKR